MESVTSDDSDVEGGAGGNNRTVTYQASSPDEVRDTPVLYGVTHLGCCDSFQAMFRKFNLFNFSVFFDLLAFLFSQNSGYFYIFTVSFIFFSKLNFERFQTERSETVDSLQNVTKFGIIVSSSETSHTPKKKKKQFLYRYFNH